MSPPSPTRRPKAINAVPLRHPWRVTAAIALILFFVLFVLDSATRPAFGWQDFAKYVFDQRISAAAFITLQLTIYSMALAIVLALILSVMRLSPNPVLNSVAWFYIWVFRGTPLYVQLVFWGLLAVIYPKIHIGIPFMEPWVSFPTTQAFSLFWLAVIGLGLNEASYLSEIMRAGIQSVDHGQTEAATALGMSWAKQMRLIVLPQAMRVIIPPTGNELIGMMKSTSLVVAVPYSWDLYTRSRDIGIEVFNPVPLLMVACAWYLLMTSILMIGQHFLEKRFARGTTLIGGTK